MTKNVWKIASRWSNTGTKNSSVLKLFQKYNIVFAGRETDRIKNSVKMGDTVAISDGLQVVAIAKVISAPTAVTSFTNIQDQDKNKFDYEDWVIAFRVEIYNLNKDEMFTTKMGTFHGMGKYSKKVLELYNKRVHDNTKFEINTYTYNILDSNQEKASLINNGQQYVIPVYQRPYSWNELQIEAFLTDIFISFWGSDKKSSIESMFIGTMQLSDKKYSDTGTFNQEVIDGQQRITTITLLLKFLKDKYSDNDILASLNFDWLDSNVNKGKQSIDLKEVLEKNNFDNELNKFAQNYKYIEKYFDLNVHVDLEEKKEGIVFKEDEFINHLLTNIYFVIIETRAGLSKTLQIFKAINTAGLDLNSTDVFKIRFYEYLSLNNDDQDIFESIDKLYEKIDIENTRFDQNVTDMSGILTIYKYYLIAKFNLGMTLWKMGTGTFFERLFDVLLDIKLWDGFGELDKNNTILDIDSINKIIDIRYKWQNKHYEAKGPFDDFDTMLSLRLMWWSRYSRYWTIPFLYSMRDNATDDKYNTLIQVLSRLYISYSLKYQKQVNEIHKFTRDITIDIIHNMDIDDVITKVKNKYKSIETETKQVISGDIFSNPKIKNILTRMSAAIDQNNNNTPIKDIEELVFNTKIDVEHIKSYNDTEFKNNPVNRDTWKSVINTIGNLVILEYSINRSIGNNPFVNKIPQYKESKFISVRQLSQKSNWDLTDAQNRKDIEIKKIEDFLYPKLKMNLE